MNKTIIASIPKAGTYLAREILVQAGLTCDPRHLSRGATCLDIAGDFRVGHPKFHDTTYKVVFLHRDLRDVLVSSIRYSMKIGKRKEKELTSDLVLRAIDTHPEEPRMAPLMEWFYNADYYMPFKALFTEEGVAKFVSYVTQRYCSREGASDLLDASINKPTETWSGKFTSSSHKKYWGDAADRAWQQTKLHGYNVLMGYEK